MSVVMSKLSFLIKTNVFILLFIYFNAYPASAIYSEEKIVEIYNLYNNERYEQVIDSINSLNYVYGGNHYDSKLLDVLTLKASSLYRLGKYDVAVEECRKILEDSEYFEGRFNPLYRDLCRNMATYCYQSDKYFRECIEWENLSLTIEKYLGEPQNYDRLITMYETAQELGIDCYPKKWKISLPIIYDTDCRRNWNKNSDVSHFRECKNKVATFMEEGECSIEAYADACEALSGAALPLGYIDEALDAASINCDIKASLYGATDMRYLKALYQYASALQKSNIDPFAPKTICNDIRESLDSLGITNTELYVDALILGSIGYSHVGANGTALRFARQAMEMAEGIVGKNSQLYDRARFNRSQQEYRDGNKSIAVRLLKETLEWRERNLDKQHPDNINALLSLAAFLTTMGSDTARYEAISYFEEFINRQAENIKENFIGLSLKEQRNYWQQFRNYYSQTIPELFRVLTPDNPQVNASLAYNAALVSKGLMFQSERLMNDILTNRDSSTQALLDSIGCLRQRINLCYSEGKTTDDPSVESMLRKISDLQDKIILEKDDYRNYLDNLFVNWQDVKANLCYGETAVEFVEINNTEQLYTLILDKDHEVCGLPTDERIRKDYAAIIISTDDEYPLFVNLFDINDIGYHDVYDNASNLKISNLIWNKINQNISKETKRIFFSPIGELQNIPIESFYNGNKDVEIYRLSTTAKLKNRDKEISHDTALLYGGLIYSNTNYSLPIELDSTDIKRAALEGVKFLPGTAREVDSIGTVFKGKAQVVKGKTGTESHFKNSCNSTPNIIHIATHGFYTNPRNIINASDLPRNVDIEDFAMQTSGLLFSGVPDDFTMDKIVGSENDGILSSAEISLMDLSSTNLVTLSACDSGIGLLDSEGTIGLQRGFKQAGANSLLMSLWKVDDEATCRLMTEFYANWIDRKMSKHDALESAKITVRETPGWEDPKYWAAFILLDALN